VFTESAPLYDLIYSSFKNYPAESAQIAELLKSIDPSYHRLLDVGCGTGEHACLLAARHGFAVDGLDIDPEFVRIAQNKNPSGRFVEADMSDFSLDTRYDAVLCLFSSIGYVKTLDRLERTLGCFRAHIRPQGCVIVEPWFPPGKLEQGHHSERIGERAGVRVRRVGTTQLDGRMSRLRFEYTIESVQGIRHATEIHELGLFTGDEMLAAFAAAGLAAQYEASGLTGRGIYVARVAD
jgi:SAM-dependent methyltransferase